MRILEYSRALRFEEAPDYGYLKSLLKSVLSLCGEVVYDWLLVNTEVQDRRSRKEKRAVARRNRSATVVTSRTRKAHRKRQDSYKAHGRRRRRHSKRAGRPALLTIS